MTQRLSMILAALIGLAAVDAVVRAGSLNDTGILACADASSNDLSCPAEGFPAQDAEQGRDAEAAAGTLVKKGGGRAGFDFTKLDGAGQDLPADAAQWDCVRDNVTGLVWEIKTDDGGLRDRDHTYSWYEPRTDRNGGNAGTQDGGSCSGSACDTAAYVAAVNAQGLCGFTDWRLPARLELDSLVDLSVAYPGPTIDTDYFPETQSNWFWSASPYAGNSYYAWGVDFGYGSGYGANESSALFVRLARGGQ